MKKFAAMGRAARKRAAVKVRQPLGQMWIYVSAEEDRKKIERQKSVLEDELNVKEVLFVAKRSEDFSIQVRPNLPRLGKSLAAKRSLIPAIQKWLQDASSEILKQQLATGYVEMELPQATQNGQPSEPSAKPVKLRLAQEDLLVERIAPPDRSFFSDAEGNYLILDLQISKELRTEGICRDLIRQIQIARKEAGFALSDRIFLTMSFAKDSKLKENLKPYFQQICEETLAEIADAPNATAVKSPAGRAGSGGEASAVRRANEAENRQTKFTQDFSVAEEQINIALQQRIIT